MVTAGLISLVGCAVLIPLLRRVSLLDVPGDRSAHVVPVPRGGGLALLAGMVAGSMAASWGPGSAGTTLPVVVLAVTAFGLLGFLDDFRGVSVGARSLAQLVIGGVAAWGLAEQFALSWVWVPLGAVAAAAYVNTVNFMDGLNGISALHGLVVGSAFGVAGLFIGADWLSVLGTATAAACAGFLVLNAPGRIFLGDVGSYALGGSLALMAGGGYFAGLPAQACLSPLAIYLADVAHTLVLRWRAGEIWYLPHRTHAYQRLVDTGWTHLQAASWVAVCTAATTMLGMLGLVASPMARAAAPVLVVAVVAVYLKVPAWRGAPSPWGRRPRARAV